MKFHIFGLHRMIWRYDWSSQLCTRVLDNYLVICVQIWAWFQSQRWIDWCFVHFPWLASSAVLSTIVSVVLIVFLWFVNSEDTGKTVIMAKVPDTITSWIASAFAMSDASGLGVSKPTSLKVFQPFFVSLTLPYSVIRGEEVSIITTVFNYEKKCLTVSEVLHFWILFW